MSLDLDRLVENARRAPARPSAAQRRRVKRSAVLAATLGAFAAAALPWAKLVVAGVAAAAVGGVGTAAVVRVVSTVRAGGASPGSARPSGGASAQRMPPPTVESDSPAPTPQLTSSRLEASPAQAGVRSGAGAGPGLSTRVEGGGRGTGSPALSALARRGAATTEDERAAEPFGPTLASLEAVAERLGDSTSRAASDGATHPAALPDSGVLPEPPKQAPDWLSPPTRTGAPLPAPPPMPPLPPAPTRSTSRATLPSSLAVELTLLRAAAQALDDGNPRAALEALAQYEHTVREGTLATEAAIIHALALCSAGEATAARELAARLRRADPQNPLLQRLRTSCAGGAAAPLTRDSGSSP
jgi:hypothetical protein